MNVADNMPKYDKLMAELKSKVECPVCLTVPTGSLMLACPRGHLVCNLCRVNMTAQGQEDCPVCREPMGNNKSLLAMVVIENMEHECTNTGCKEKTVYEEVTKHREELCKFRPILCPVRECEKLVPFSSFDGHAEMCPHLDVEIGGKVEFTFGRDTYENGNGAWNVMIFHRKKETFALRLGMRDNNFYFESLMLAERDKCDRFMTTISIPNPKSVTSFDWRVNPRPMGPTNIEESVIIVHKKSLAKVFTELEEDGDLFFFFTIHFKVSEKRAIDVLD